MIKARSILVVGLLAVIAVEGGILLDVDVRDIQGLVTQSAAEPKSFQAYAADVMERCADAPWKPACYDEEIPKLMDVLSLEDTFHVTKELQQFDKNYWYCHVLGHNVSARETAKDPSKWKEVVARCPSGMCSNGCIHGAFQERFRTESLEDDGIEALLPDLQTICEGRNDWSPTGMEKSTCYHALGHLIMYITNADIRKSNALCERVAPTHLRVCLDGNFMQIFQPLEPEDFALIEKYNMKTPEDAADFCRNFSGQQFGACWRESWPLSKEKIRTPTGLVQFCEQIRNDPAEKKSCYKGMFYVVAAQSRLNVDTVRDFCSKLPANVQGACFANSASRFIETDYSLMEGALALCAAAAKLGVEQECYAGLITESRFNFHADSDDSAKLCSALPEPWKSKCTL